MTAVVGQERCGGKATDALKMRRLPLMDGHLILLIFETASGYSNKG